MDKMSLEYIWIDKHILYKNIGFSFGNDFDIDFNNGNNILNIEKKKNLISKLLPENIKNINAIVGENGSGKTQLLNIISDIIYHIFNRLSNKGGDIPLNFNNECMFKYIAIFMKDKKLYIITNNNSLKVEINVEYTILEIYTECENLNKGEKKFLNEFQIIKYSGAFDEKLIYSNDYDEMNFSVVTDIKDTFKDLQEKIKENFIEAVNQYKHNNLYKNKNQDEHLYDSWDLIEEDLVRQRAEDIISPVQMYKNISISKDINWLYNIAKNNDIHDLINKIPKKINFKLSTKGINKDKLIKEWEKYKSDISHLLKKMNNKFVDPGFISFFTLLLYEILKLLDKDSSRNMLLDIVVGNATDSLDTEDVLSWINNLVEETSIGFKGGYENIHDIQNFMNKMINLTSQLKNPSDDMKSIKNLIKFFTLFCKDNGRDNYVTDSYDFNITCCDILRDYDNLEYIITADKTYVNTDFVEVTLNYDNFSTGEVMRFKMFSRLYMGILKRIKRYDDNFTIRSKEEIQELELNSKQCLYLLLLDEPELTMHPKWQRDFVSNLIDFLEYNFKEYKFQIIFTTNSPMTLTEVAHTNIIKLKKNKQENITRIEEIKKPTLGANLYDLYKDSFFFGDSFCGTYVNKVINIILERLNKNELNDEDIDDINYLISLIGDSVISEILKEKLRNKCRINKYNNMDTADKMKNVLSRFDNQISKELAEKLIKEFIKELN